MYGVDGVDGVDGVLGVVVVGVEVSVSVDSTLASVLVGIFNALDDGVIGSIAS